MFVYSLDAAVRYDAQDEWHLDPESTEGVNLVNKSLLTYANFANEFRHILDLHSIDTIDQVYQAACEAEIFALATSVRQTFFAHDIHFYGVTYLWDMCIESCIYCPAALSNRTKTKYKPLNLSIDDAVKDVQYLMEDGHRHICVLAGEDPLRHPPKELAEYIRAFDQLGLKEIILNVEPPAHWQDFELWRGAAQHTALQFRVFQETYNRKKYSEIHPMTKHGRKHNFDNRYESQELAIACGFDHVGLGVLFGNHHLPIEEIDGLQTHAIHLRNKTKKWPARICLPSAKYLAAIEVSIPFSFEAKQNSYWKLSKILYALARLAMPCISIVSSERDEPNLLTELDYFATCTTLNVHPGVGDNIRHHENLQHDQIHFEQAPSFSRHPKTTPAAMTARGFRPLLANLTSGG